MGNSKSRNKRQKWDQTGIQLTSSYIVPIEVYQTPLHFWPYNVSNGNIQLKFMTNSPISELTDVLDEIQNVIEKFTKGKKHIFMRMTINERLNLILTDTDFIELVNYLKETFEIINMILSIKMNAETNEFVDFRIE